MSKKERIALWAWNAGWIGLAALIFLKCGGAR